jgi:hypothetical protein
MGMVDLDRVYREQKRILCGFEKSVEAAKKELCVTKYFMSLQSNPTADIKSLLKICSRVQVDKIEASVGGSFF